MQCVAVLFMENWFLGSTSEFGQGNTKTILHENKVSDHRSQLPSCFHPCTIKTLNIDLSGFGYINSESSENGRFPVIPILDRENWSSEKLALIGTAFLLTDYCFFCNGDIQFLSSEQNTHFICPLWLGVKCACCLMRTSCSDNATRKNCNFFLPKLPLPKDNKSVLVKRIDWRFG